MSGWLILTAIVMWVSQTLLGLWQFKRFHRRVRELRRDGRVAIGKAKGRFLAGAVVLLSIDGDGRIFHGEIMRGRTVFAGFQVMDSLNGKLLEELAEEDLKGLGAQVKTAVLDAKRELKDFMKLQEEEKAPAEDPRPVRLSKDVTETAIS